MKAVRKFSIEDGFLRMETVFLPEEDSLDDPMSCKVLISIDPDSSAPQAFFLDCDSSFPLYLRLQEVKHAMSVVCQMFSIRL